MALEEIAIMVALFVFIFNTILIYFIRRKFMKSVNVLKEL